MGIDLTRGLGEAFAYSVGFLFVFFLFLFPFSSCVLSTHHSHPIHMYHMNTFMISILPLLPPHFRSGSHHSYIIPIILFYPGLS